MSDLIRKSFEFGPGTSQVRSHFRTFNVPARSLVSVAVEKLAITPSGSGSIPVIIEVRQAIAAGVGATGPDGPLLATRITNAPNSAIFAFQNQSFSSSFGCPHSWRIRVRSAISPVPVKVSGIIIFAFTPPGPVTLDMSGTDTQHLDPNVTANRTLRHRAGTSPSHIDGTGRFRIKAKWHTDPLDVFQLGSFQPLTVTLLRPDGTAANSETGYSQHAPANRTPKVDFSYTVTPADALLPGDWRLRIRNNTSVRVVDFDVDRGFDPNPAMPNFTSTFKAGCG